MTKRKNKKLDFNVSYKYFSITNIDFLTRQIKLKTCDLHPNFYPGDN